MPNFVKSVKGIYLFVENLHQKLLKPLFTPDKHFQFTVTGAATYPFARGRHPTQLNSTQLTTPKEKSGLQEERSYKSLYKSPILQ